MASLTGKIVATALEALTSKQQRNINCLSDPNRSTRRRALKKFVQEFNAPPKKKQRPVHAAFFKASLQTPLLSCLADEIEKCRECSCALLTHFTNHVLTDTADHPAIYTLFTLVLPILQNRIGSTPFAEPTEEIRLCLVDLLNALLVHPAVTTSTQLPDLGPDILALYARACQDPYPDVKKSCALGIVQLSQVAPTRLHSNMDKCIVGLIGNLGHQHSRVRSATLQAMGALLPQGAEALESLMQEKVLTAFRSVSADRSGSVRKTVVSTAAKLCTELPMPERFHADLLQLVLGGIADEADDVKEHSAREMCALGSSVINANQLKPSSELSYHEKIWQKKQNSSVLTEEKANQEHKEEQEGQEGQEERKVASAVAVVEQDPAEQERLAALVPTLGAPFDKVTPNQTAKSMVQALLPQLLPPVLGELAEWTVARRSHAAGVLSALLVFAEGHAVSFIPQILASLGNACRDDEITVAARAFSCAELLGLFLPLEAVLDELLPIIGEYGAHTNRMISPQERSGLLMILSAVMTSAQLTIGTSVDDAVTSTKWTCSTADLMKRVVTTLALPVVCESDAIEVQSQLVEVMLDVISVGCADVAAKNTRTTSFALLDSRSTTNLQFVRILVQLQATPGDDPGPAKVRQGATSTMGALAEASGASGTSAMYAAHFERMLRIILSGRVVVMEEHSNGRKGSNPGTLARLRRENNQAATSDSSPGIISVEGEEKVHPLSTATADDNTVAPKKEKISTMAKRAGRWEKSTPQRRLFDTLIRQSMSDVNAASNPVGDHLHLILPILEATLQVSCDPDLRMGMLALVATMLENQYVAQVCREREAYGGTMLQRLFLPNAVWRVGRVASSVRKIDARCISTLLRHKLVTCDALAVLWQEPNNLLNVMKSCLDDDEPLTRQYTALALMNIFEVMEGKLDMETCMVGGWVFESGVGAWVLGCLGGWVLSFSVKACLFVVVVD